MPQVLNRKDIPNSELRRPDLVYVGRPTKWGNPFVVGKDGTREEVIAKYRAWLRNHPDLTLLLIVKELRGKDLACWCAPEACHADVLLKLANA